MLYLYRPRLAPALHVWRRNFLVWRKFIGASTVVNFGEPLFFLLGLGYGLGLFVGDVMNMPYLAFLASGILASSAMNASSYEATYAVYTRMVPQRTYEAILATPVDVPDILLGEMIWCATKSLINGGAILVVATLLGAVHDARALWAVPVLVLVGLAFAGPGLVASSIARGHDFFSHYTTLFLTPMFVLSGVFYPVSTLPPALRTAMKLLPLTHAVDLLRPLVAGQPLTNVGIHVAALAAYAVGGYLVAVRLVRRRLLT